jgi:hypothetical protein
MIPGQPGSVAVGLRCHPEVPALFAGPKDLNKKVSGI